MTENPGLLKNWKIIEERESGELVLLKDNLDKLLEQSDVDCATTPIVVGAVLGSKSSGKSFYTNLLTEYLSHNGKSWTKRMKEKGLKGFPYGNVASAGLKGEEMGSGVYFWPKLFLLEKPSSGKKVLVWVIHVHHGGEGGDQQQESVKKDALDRFVGVASSRLVDIVWKGRSVAGSLVEDESEEMKQLVSNFCQSIVYLERRSPAGEEKSNQNGCSKARDPSSVVSMADFSSPPLHDHNGVICFTGAQQRAVTKLMEKITEETELPAKTFGSSGTVLKMGNIKEFLEYCVHLVNSSGGFGSVHAAALLPVVNKSVTQSEENIEPGAMKDSEKKNKIQKFKKGTNSKSNADDNLSQRRSEINRPKQPEVEERKRMEYRTPSNATPKEEKSRKPLAKEKESATVNLETLKKQLLARSIWPKLHTCLTKWITEKLTKENVAEIQNLFDTFMKNMNREDMAILRGNGMAEAEAKRFMEALGQDKNMVKWKIAFEDVYKALSGFCASLDDAFLKTPGGFPSDNLKERGKVIKKNIMKTMTLSEVVTDLVEHGIQKLLPFYEMYNNRRCQEEKSLSFECLQQIRAFYQQEMKNVCPENQIQGPHKLVQIHEQLVTHLQVVLERSLGPVPNIGELRNELERQLTNDFLEIEARNRRSIESNQKKVNSLVMKGKSEYEMKMDEFFEENSDGDGIPRETFNAEDERITQETIEHFKTALRALLPQRAMLDNYLLTLNHFLERSRASFRDENETNLRKHVKEAQEPERAHSQVQQRELHTYGSSGQPPLLIQLGAEKIGIGIMKKDNSVQVKFIPPLIGLTQDDEWVCGDQLATLQGSVEGQHFVQGPWNIGDCLFHGDQEAPPFGETTVNDVSVPITTEFLLAIFFRHVKQTVEKEQGGKSISDLKITVPFWSPSSLRQQVLDATQIAGFAVDNVHIISENSAAAYYMFESGLHHPKYSTIVLCENSDMLDVCLYYYDEQYKRLSMMSHCGDCDGSANNQSYWVVQKLSNLISAFKQALQLGQSAAGQQEKWILDKTSHMCKVAVDRADNFNFGLITRVRNVLICCQSDKLPDLLTQVALKLDGVSEKRLIAEDRAAILGMASIHKVMVMEGLSAEAVVCEGMPYDVNIYSPTGAERKPFLKNDTFRLSLRQKRGFSDQGQCFFANESGSYSIVQKADKNARTLGVANLTITGSSVNKNTDVVGIAVTLIRSHQGIISLQNLEWTRRSFSNVKNERIREVEKEAYEWIQKKLHDESLAKYISLMDYVKFQNTLAATFEKEKKLTEGLGETIIRAINEGRGNFKNKIMKTLVSNQVNDAIQPLKGTPCQQFTENELKQKHEFLKNILRIYNLG